MAEVAALTHVNVTSFETQCGIGFQSGDRLGQRILKKQRNDLNQTTNGYDADDEDNHQAYVLFNFVVC